MNVPDLIAKLTLEEKASLCSGSDFWHTQPIDRLGIPALMLSDGPHGLRKQSDSADHLGINDSILAVCFPTGCTVAASFDKDLIRKMGEALGESCQAENLAVLLGPAVNIKRSPLCGRNFEYFSEDPYLTSEMAGSQINGIQSQNVGTSIKHFLANNQEHRRMTSNSEVDERTLREIYLASFEGAVKQASPWTVMCSYNRINGTYASENERYLTKILRDEWGFKGLVVSDWGAVNDRVAGVKAGLDLEMPSSNGVNDARIIDAVKSGALSETELNRTVEHVLNLIERYTSNRNPAAIFDRDVQHELSCQIARESMVLLKNEDNILPLSKDSKVAFIGQFAAKPRFQGGGSSHVNSHRVTSALDAVSGWDNISYAPGYDLKMDSPDEQLLAEAVALAKDKEVAVVFAGLPDSFESEGYDRKHLAIPQSHQTLIEAVSAVQPNTIVVLHNGSPVEMPWISQVKGILEAYLGGQAVGQAVVDVLFGDANPCGRLAETFPRKLEDNPSYLNFPGEQDTVEYREGIFVGYRYYDKKKMDVLFPFGHGLSFTQFAYSHLHLDKKKMTDQEMLCVEVDVTNTGSRAGKEVVQLYVADLVSTMIRPVKELKGFEKLDLKPGETKTATFQLEKRAFACYNLAIEDWHVETGDFEILIGRSSQEIVLRETIHIDSTQQLFEPLTINSTFGDVQKNPKAEPLLSMISQAFAQFISQAVEGSADEKSPASEAITPEMNAAMIQDMPLRAFIGFGIGSMSYSDLQILVDQINGKD